MATITNRLDFLYLFDCKNGNPNGDPDNENSPRVNDKEHGLTTDVMIKRKLRNYVALEKGDEPGYSIFVKDGSVLNSTIDAAHDAVKSKSVKGKKDGVSEQLAQDYLCKTFYDIRAFGAVLSTGSRTAGKVTGPLQFTFTESIDPVTISEHCITRCAVTNDKELKDTNDEEKKRTMGRKSILDYGLYKGYGFVNTNLAVKTGFSQEDLDLSLRGLMSMFEQDRSAARGLMTTRRGIVFEHSGMLGNASAASLFERVKVALKEGIEVPTCFNDYEITIDFVGLPAGIRVMEVNFDGTLSEIGSV